MGRPKGSKNKVSKAKEIVDPVDQVDEIDEDVEVEAVSEDNDDGYAEPADEPTGPPPGMSRVAYTPEEISEAGAGATLLQAIREQTAALTASMPPRKVHVSQFKTRSKFNPTGRRRTLKYIVYQNGYRTNPATLHDEEFDLINSGKIKPGQYLSRLVTVRIERASSPEDVDKIHISYNNKTQDQRMINRDYWSPFGDLLKKIIAEGEARKMRINKRRQLELSQ